MNWSQRYLLLNCLCTVKKLAPVWVKVLSHRASNVMAVLAQAGRVNQGSKRGILREFHPYQGVCENDTCTLRTQSPQKNVLLSIEVK